MLRSWLRRLDWRVLPLYALIAIAAAISFGYHRLLLANRDLVEHTYEVITTLEAALACMTDAETGQRGYVLTGSDAYLAPYRKALVDIPTLLARLRGLVADSPAQSDRVGRLESAIADKLAELERTVTARERAGMDAARNVVMSDVGRRAMDAVRDRIADLRNAEGDLLIRRNATARRTEQHMLVVTLICATLSLAARFGLARWGPSRGSRDTNASARS